MERSVQAADAAARIPDGGPDPGLDAGSAGRVPGPARKDLPDRRHRNAVGPWSIDVDLLQGERIVYQGQPSARASAAFFARWGTLGLLPGIVASVMAANGIATGLSLVDWWVVSLVLVVLVIIRNAIVRHSMRFTVTNQRIMVRHGILARTEQTAAIARVQNITTRQTIVQRMLNVGDVEFDTAGGDLRDADFRFVGVIDPQSVVRTVDLDARHAHHDAWATGL
jgi:membrane protein YdbS with pleckstrin-like domain